MTIARLSAKAFCLLLTGPFFNAHAQNDVVVTEEEAEQLIEEQVDAIEKTEDKLRQEQERLNDLRKQFPATRVATAEEVLESFKAENSGSKVFDIDVYNGRAYKKKDMKFPWELKCTTVDFRMFHGCLELRFFDPSARVYFDTGVDDVDEVDVFNDGNLNVTVELASVYFPWRLGKSEFFDSWTWGPVIGAGIGAAAKDSEDGSVEASGAPVVLFSIGAMLERKLESGASFAFELGRSTGFSSDESLGDSNDSALYVGLRINVPIGKKGDPKTVAEPDASN